VHASKFAELFRLSNDRDRLIRQIAARPCWRGIPRACVAPLVDNAAHVFTSNWDAMDAVRRTVFILETPRFEDRLRLAARSPAPMHELSELSEHLLHASLRERSVGAALCCTSAALACERNNLGAYYAMAWMQWNLRGSADAAELWCDRYRNAAAELRRAREGDLGRIARAWCVIARRDAGFLAGEAERLRCTSPWFCATFPEHLGPGITMERPVGALEEEIRRRHA
jgi:hypothetical protein